ncbi:MAG: site-specific integrase, partial [Actinomycetota bacterium]|nr:site-specific integrase [Actinomycetota bacterium]
MYAKTRKDAAAKLRAAIAERDGGVLTDAGKLLTKDYLRCWIDDIEGTIRPRSWDRCEQMCRVHLTPALGNVKLKALSPAHIQPLYRSKLADGLAPGTIQHIHRTLSKALKAAVRRGLIPRNPCDAVDPPRPVREEIRPLTAAEVKRFLKAAAGDPYEPLYLLAVTTGLRQGEILAIRWQDVDLSNGTVRINRTLTTRNGRFSFNLPKSAKSRRTVCLTTETVSALTLHRQRQQEAALYRRESLMFCTGLGTPINPSNLLQRSFKPHLERAGLPDIRFHDLRHTCATLLLSRNVHPKIVSDLLGHASIQLTLDTY